MNSRPAPDSASPRTILRYTAFSADPDGGNPAGVVLDATGLSDEAMQRTAAEIGYSETAFAFPGVDRHLKIRYFSPLIEVPFCGHATIATAVAHAHHHGAGTLRLATLAGPVSVTTRITADGSIVATLVTVPPRCEPLESDVLNQLLEALRWPAKDLDPAFEPRVAYAGARHPVIAARTRARLTDLDYDMPALSALMADHDWATVNLIWQESPGTYHARNPFPPGGVVEDPATGAAAAALGGYLQALGMIELPATITIHQGHDMGRPSLISVAIPVDAAEGISVTGTAVRL